LRKIRGKERLVQRIAYLVSKSLHAIKQKTNGPPTEQGKISMLMISCEWGRGSVSGGGEKEIRNKRSSL